MNNRQLCAFLAVTALAVAACEPKENATPAPAKESDAKYVGQAVGNFSAAEWYPGGELGTTDNITEGCYEDETPAVTEQGEYDEKINPFIDSDVLYIDDLFKSRGTSVPMPTEPDVRLAYQIINARYASGKPTIISCEWYLREELHGQTVILISHRISTLMVADEIAVLHQGSILQQGTHEELYRTPGLYRDICEIQSVGEEAAV